MGSGSVRLQNRSENHLEQTGSDYQTLRTMKSGTRVSLPLMHDHKPRPSAKTDGSEVPVKHMSNIPHYLQRMEPGDNVQEKALNVGVINWERLQKWAYDQEHVVNNRNGYSSLSISNTSSSSSCSASNSSSQSYTSSGSCLARRNKSTSLNGRQASSVEACLTKIIKEDNIKHGMGFSDFKASPISTSTRYRLHSERNFCIGTDHPGFQQEKKERKDPQFETVTHNKAQPPDIGISAATSKDYKNYADIALIQNGRSGEARKPHTYEQQNCQGSLIFYMNSPQDHSLIFSSNIEGMWDDLQQNVNRRCNSFDSSTYGSRRPTEGRRKSFSVNNPPKDVILTNLSPHVSHSCSLPSVVRIDEPEGAGTPLSKIEVPVTKSKGNHAKHKQFAEEFAASEVDRWGQDKAKRATKGRELSPNHQSSAFMSWMKRNSSSREGLSIGQTNWTSCSDNSHGDKATANIRGRRSPLRRILDPLLKSKNGNILPGPIVASLTDNANKPCVANRPPTLKESSSIDGPRKSFGATRNSYTSQGKGNLESSSQASFGSHDSLQDEKHGLSNRQALLKLTWNNGTPLLMLSSNDNNILTATMRKRSISDKDNSEFIYTILSIHEVKKRNGAWINQGNKIKKHGLFSDVVGQLKVSSPKLIGSDSKGQFVVREFVLLGAELTPASQEPVSSMFSNELAAIIVKTREKVPEGALSDVLISDNYWDLSQANSAEDNSTGCQAGSLQSMQIPENLSLSSIAVLLPDKIHGSSATGEPSPLIGRWKSGGICDCGGWDEGCMLTVLVDKFQESKKSSAVQAFPTMGGSNLTELFVQGRTGENKHAFSMVGCKEGQYTVEFCTSIALIQVFAICIASLYNWKPTNPPVNDSANYKSFENIFSNNMRTPATTQRGAPIKHILHHRPVSPVGRA